MSPRPPETHMAQSVEHDPVEEGPELAPKGHAPAFPDLHPELQAEARVIFTAESDIASPDAGVIPVEIDGHGMEEILQGAWRFLEDLTADQERQASTSPPEYPAPPRDTAAEGSSFTPQVDSAYVEPDIPREPCPPRENPDWWATASVMRENTCPTPPEVPSYESDDDSDLGSLAFGELLKEWDEDELNRDVELADVRVPDSVEPEIFNDPTDEEVCITHPIVESASPLIDVVAEECGGPTPTPTPVASPVVAAAAFDDSIPPVEDMRNYDLAESPLSAKALSESDKASPEGADDEVLLAPDRAIQDPEPEPEAATATAALVASHEPEDATRGGHIPHAVAESRTRLWRCRIARSESADTGAACARGESER